METTVISPETSVDIDTENSGSYLGKEKEEDGNI